MSKYTTELRYLIENHFDLGLQDYPIFAESYREHLNSKIIDHYFFREIGFETAELFKVCLNRRMREIMPYFNQRYESEKIKFNPLINVDITTTGNTDFTGKQTLDGTVVDSGNTKFTGNVVQNGTSNTTQDTASKTDTTENNNNHTKSVHSDTPQGLLGATSIDSETWATDATLGKSIGNAAGTTTTTGNSETDTTTHSTTDTTNNTTAIDTTKTDNITDTKNVTDNVSHTLGKSPSETYSEMLNKFRETFINVDMEIIDALSDLFMNIY